MTPTSTSLFYKQQDLLVKFLPSRLGRYPADLGSTPQITLTVQIPVSVCMNNSEYIVNNLRLQHHAPPSPHATSLIQFLQQRSDWEHLLLTNIHYKRENLFYTLLKKQAPLLIVLDGGAHQAVALGAYGWTIVTIDGVPLVTNQGHCFGPVIDSFRSKAYGTLSACVFLQAIYDFHNLIPLAILHCCDNDGLVRRLNHQKTSPTIKTEAPHWDLTGPILKIL